MAGKVVFRGLVQDIFEPEYVKSEVAIVNLETQERRVVNLVENPDVKLEDNEMVDDRSSKYVSRTPVYLVEVPGLTEWASKSFKTFESDSVVAHIETKPIPSAEVNLREIDGSNNDDLFAQNDAPMTRQPASIPTADANSTPATAPTAADATTAPADGPKDEELPEHVHKTKRGAYVFSGHLHASVDDLSGTAGALGARARLLNFPLGEPPVSSTPRCMIAYIYEQSVSETLRLGDVLEARGELFGSKEEQSARGVWDDEEPMVEENEADFLVMACAAKGVPRMHARTVQRRTQTHMMAAERTVDAAKAAVSKEGAAALDSVLMEATNGDVHVSQALSLCLASSPISHAGVGEDLTSMGQVTLSVENASGALVDRVHVALQAVAPVVVRIDLDVRTLNSRLFSPFKDFERNRVVAAPLQLPVGAVLILDETKLHEGNLTLTGQKNLAALQALAQDLIVKVACGPSEVLLRTAYKVINFSSRKSVIAAGFKLRVSASPAANSPVSPISEDALVLARQHLMGLSCLASSSRIEISPESSSVLEKAFVAARAKASTNGQTAAANNKINEVDLTRWIDIARSLASIRVASALNEDATLVTDIAKPDVCDRWGRTLSIKLLANDTETAIAYDQARIARLEEAEQELQRLRRIAAGTEPAPTPATEPGTPVQAPSDVEI